LQSHQHNASCCLLQAVLKVVRRNTFPSTYTLGSEHVPGNHVGPLRKEDESTQIAVRVAVQARFAQSSSRETVSPVFILVRKVKRPLVVETNKRQSLVRGRHRIDTRVPAHPLLDQQAHAPNGEWMLHWVSFVPKCYFCERNRTEIRLRDSLQNIWPSL
jgi:hypothetical protein